jgi:hypothetical protein
MRGNRRHRRISQGTLTGLLRLWLGAHRTARR